MFSVTSTAPTAAATESSATKAVPRNPVGCPEFNKKRRLKPFKRGHRRQERLQSSLLLD
jgi:hypothetical protein